MTRLVLCLLALLAGCDMSVPNPRYHLGAPYQVRGNWFYPAENYGFDETGLASVYAPGHASLTTNGERYDRSVAAIGHPSLQLPAIAKITNLENGLSIVVRVNDRGEGSPTRFVQVTERLATLLRMSSPNATKVRVQLLPAESKAAVATMPGAPKLDIAVAPRGAVVADALPPPGAEVERKTVSSVPAASGDTASATIERLPETLFQEPVRPTRLWVRLDTFESYRYAEQQERKMRYNKTTVEETVENRVRRFTVKIGPFDTPREADETVRTAFSVGIPDARIVAE